MVDPQKTRLDTPCSSCGGISSVPELRLAAFHCRGNESLEGLTLSPDLRLVVVVIVVAVNIVVRYSEEEKWTRRMSTWIE